MSGIRSLIVFLAANIGVGATALAVGWLLSDTVGFDVAAAPALRPRLDTVGTAYWAILAGNLRVVGVMAASVCTFGTLAFFLLVLNALRAGAGIAALHHCCPATAGLVWRYLPIEFMALALAAGASQSLAHGWATNLAWRGRLNIAPHLAVFAITVVLLALAAGVESRAFLGSA